MKLISQKDAGPIRLRARDSYCRGDIAAAIAIQRSLVEATREDSHPGDYLFLGSMLVASGDYAAGRDVMLGAHERWPEEPQFVGSIGICESHLRRWSEAIPWLKRAAALTPNDANLHDCLAWTYVKLGDLDRARDHGERSLVLKDKLTAGRRPKVSLAEVPVLPLREDDPRRNVIAFSLFGSLERYCRGAVENARVAPHLYPGWICRFYCDPGVPEMVRASLLAEGAEVVLMPTQRWSFEGLFWRFHVANDPEVDRYLVRDCDALLNVRERVAVEAWIESGKHFHVMRDFYSHSDLILAGMWGGVHGALPELRPLYIPYLEDVAKAANCDQRFLREAVWPTVRHSVCTHDRLFRVLDAQPFPPGAMLPVGRHVGQDMVAWRPADIGRLADRTGAEQKARRRSQFVFALTTTSKEAEALAALLKVNLTDAEVHHCRDAPDNLGAIASAAALIRQFNNGVDLGELRDLWRRKFALELYGAAPVYAETSHLLAVAGLMENLDLLGEEVRIDVVALRRSPEEILRELDGVAAADDRRRFPDELALRPQFLQRIVEPAAYLEAGWMGELLWYVTEMAARAAYYRMLLREQPNVRVHSIDLDTLKRPAGAVGFLRALGSRSSVATVPLPLAPGGAGSKEPRSNPEFLKLIERHPLQARRRARSFLEAGRRLGRVPKAGGEASVASSSR